MHDRPDWGTVYFEADFGGIPTLAPVYNGAKCSIT
jgi:hypothetical protein